jgi:hypothetical protein
MMKRDIKDHEKDVDSCFEVLNYSIDGGAETTKQGR